MIDDALQRVLFERLIQEAWVEDNGSSLDDSHLLQSCSHPAQFEHEGHKASPTIWQNQIIVIGIQHQD